MNKKPMFACLGLLLLAALGVFLFLDYSAAVSVDLKFVAAYLACCVLVGALLTEGCPLRQKLVVLGFVSIAILSVRFIDWDSRKPFLRAFYRVDGGMTAAQVDRIMNGYSIRLGADAVVDVQGQIVAGTVSYRHTNGGWGDSDLGVLTFEDGRVERIRFLPD